MPPLAGDYQRVSLIHINALQLFFHQRQNILFQLLPLLIFRIELQRQFLRHLRVLRQQKLHALLRRSDTPRRIQARSEHEPHMSGCKFFPLLSRDLDAE